MERVFGLDIGTTSIGFAVVECDEEQKSGTIRWLGARIFPEARDTDGTPLNQQRRAKRMIRRQLRRRRQRRRRLNETLCQAGLLPPFDPGTSSAWSAIMRCDPYLLRRRGLSEPLAPHELGRALYHLAQRRHFKGREIEDDDPSEEVADEKEASDARATTRAALAQQKVTLGTWLAAKQADATRANPPRERRRGVHADRSAVEEEFSKLWEEQQPHHPVLTEAGLRESVEEAIFFQRPVFWRRNTLGQCRLMPGEDLCPRGSWLSQQRRMLEKLNNLALVGGNQRPLDPEERAAILERLQTQGSMTWAGVRKALAPLYAARGEKGAEKGLRFNLELGGDKTLPGNAVEQKLAGIFGPAWATHPRRAELREAVQARIWLADYGQSPDGKRVVIRPASERAERRRQAAESFVRDFGLSQNEARAIAGLTFPSGWEPFSAAALRHLLPKLEEGVRFGALLSGPEWEAWRDCTFPDRARPTGEFRDALPSPANREEQARIAGLRNPTVVRVQNELRKVVNNLIRAFGKPDRIRVELAREVGRSRREREDHLKRTRERERERKAALAELRAGGIAEPSRADIEKWLLWAECGKFDPYSGLPISFADLFAANVFQVEHIWPLSSSLDDGFGNKTLCHRDWNTRKNKRTPFQAFGHSEDWAAMKERVWRLVAEKRMARGKAQRFCREVDLPEDFASRQLNDTGYAARQAVAVLKRLWPDLGPQAPVRVEAVSGRVTAHLRRLWELNGILGTDGEKTRADHRHHALDALVVACARPGVTQLLSRYWQEREGGTAARPKLPPPWDGIRADASRAVAAITVSHRVRKKLSGPLHKETVYGDTGIDATTKTGVYRQFVTRKRVEQLSRTEIEDIRDSHVRSIIKEWVAANGGDPKKAFATYPLVGGNGPEIRKVRLTMKQQPRLMAKLGTGYADMGNNHHIEIFRERNGEITFEVLSLFHAARRMARREPVIARGTAGERTFVMSLAPGEALERAGAEGGQPWIVQGVWANGQIVLERANDAAHATTTRPNPSTLLKGGARKISIDPIGRIRPAHD